MPSKNYISLFKLSKTCALYLALAVFLCLQLSLASHELEHLHSNSDHCEICITIAQAGNATLPVLNTAPKSTLELVALEISEYVSKTSSTYLLAYSALAPPASF